MEPLSVLAGLFTTIALPKFLEKAGEEVGNRVGGKVADKSGETICAIQTMVKGKLEEAGTFGLLTRVQKNPTEQNVQILEGELVNHMEEDNEFALRLQQLMDQLSVQLPTFQTILDTVRVKGNVEVGDVEQISDDRLTQQVVGRNVGVEGDFKIKSVTQKISKSDD